MSDVEPTYAELKERCLAAEATLQAIRSGETETVLGEKEPLMIRLAESEKRAAHLKQVLLAIRNVNQLITRESDPKRLVQHACDTLTENLGYYNAWIALVADSNSAATLTGSAGFDGSSQAILEGFEGGSFPDCMKSTLQQDTVTVITDPPAECPNCHLSHEYSGRSALSRRLAHSGEVYGVLTASIPSAYADDDEEIALFEEVAGDLGFALHKISERKRFKDELSLRDHRFRSMVEQSPFPTMLHAEDGEILAVNKTWCEITGYDASELATIADWIERAYRETDDLESIRAGIQGLYDLEGRTSEGEFTILCRDGTHRVWDFSSTPLGPLPDGRRTAISMAIDVTERKEAEERLRSALSEQEWLLRSMINAFVLFESVFDENGTFISYRFVYINESYERITGVKNDEVHGKTVHQVWPGTEASWIQKYGEVAVTGQSQTFDMYHEPTKKLYHCNVYRPWDTKERFCVVFEDITERRQMEEELALLARFPSENPHPVLRVDADGRISHANSAASNLTGPYRLEVGELVPTTLRDAVSLAYHSGDNITREVVIGGRFFQFSLAPVSEHGYVNLYAQETTTRRMAEAEVHKLNAELEKRVRERTASLENANRELETFAYSVSHDLRAPLRAIHGFAEIIARRYRDDLTEEARRYFDNILQAGNQMSELIDDLLAYSRLGRKALKIERVDPRVVLSAVLTEFDDRIRDTSSRMAIPETFPTIMADPTLLKVIFRNLLDNALKYHAPRACPEVEVRFKQQEDRVVFQIVDNGIGIEKEYQEKVFNVFQRLHPESKYPGTGIGLGLVKKATMLLGGSVWVDSDGANGSTFNVQLPVEPTQGGGETEMKKPRN